MLGLAGDEQTAVNLNSYLEAGAASQGQDDTHTARYRWLHSDGETETCIFKFLPLILLLSRPQSHTYPSTSPFFIFFFYHPCVLLIFQSPHVSAKAEKWRDAKQPKGALLIRVMLHCAKHNASYIIITATQ